MNAQRTSRRLLDLFNIATEAAVEATEQRRTIDALGHMAQAHGIALAAVAIDLSHTESDQWITRRDRTAQTILKISDLITAKQESHP